MIIADWYFDFISPFSYLQWAQRRRFEDSFALRPVPILFAGVLAHWGHKGPAEIDSKRRFTYRHVAWLAQRLEIPLRFPPAHPFNPLRALRLGIALDNEPAVIDAIFQAIWRDGGDLGRDADWQALTTVLGVDDAAARLGAEPVKTALRHNTEQAIARGVFGVPTLAIGEQLFWGLDAGDMAMDYAADPDRFDPEWQRLDQLPLGVRRQ